MDDLDQDEMMEYLSTQMTPERAILKVVEEANELAEKAIKWHNKPVDKKPSYEDLLEEFGDLALRFALFSLCLKIDLDKLGDGVEERVDNKLKQLYIYFKGKEAK